MIYGVKCFRHICYDYAYYFIIFILNSGIVDYLVKGCDGVVAFSTPMVVFINNFVSVESNFEVAYYVFFNNLFNCAKVIKWSKGSYIVD